MPSAELPRRAKADLPRIRSATAAVAFGVYADLAYNLYSATNSSPQTTELFAGERTNTLWKYVRLGHVQAAVLGLFGSILDRTLWPLFGTASIGVVMHCMYAHALKVGQGIAPPTRNVAKPGGTPASGVPNTHGAHNAVPMTRGRRRGSS